MQIINNCVIICKIKFANGYQRIKYFSPRWKLMVAPSVQNNTQCL